MKKKKIKILHVAQAAGGVDRYIRMLLKYLDKEKFENILICSQDFRKEDYKGLVDSFEQVKMERAIGAGDLEAIKAVRKLIKKYNPDIVYILQKVRRKAGLPLAKGWFAVFLL
ncbi:glycosyltransferase [Faecalibacterium prausnitzii]|uniref:glycosyltransferase n=1 Tax=Faecalibacterium prausnitzii TaxID=853 RepID=UPI00236669F0|nr:glycosyltransferase [Faecalibacterium prausnitzii]